MKPIELMDIKLSDMDLEERFEESHSVKEGYRKRCRACGNQFWATSPTSKWCDGCGAHRTAARKRAQAERARRYRQWKKFRRTPPQILDEDDLEIWTI